MMKSLDFNINLWRVIWKKRLIPAFIALLSPVHTTIKQPTTVYSTKLTWVHTNAILQFANA